MKNAFNASVALVALAASAALPAFAKVELATPFADNMVLQRDRKVPVWGKAEAGRTVTVAFAGQEKSAVACAKGCWRVELDPLATSKENRTLTVTESEGGFLFDTVTDRAEVRNVLVGEVWMCSGQSNTDCPIWGTNPHYRDAQGAAIMSMAMKPYVRLAKTAFVPATTPRRDFRAHWVAMTPRTLGYLSNERKPSAMGYLFALELANALDIPIGLVDSSVGGTNIDAWTPPSGYANHPELRDVTELPLLDKSAFEKARKEGVYKGKGIYGGWHQQPAALWNGMVAAYAPMAIRGFIWYQGCHNAGEYPRYADKMHALYDGWAKEFKNPELKLYFVQLAPWGYADIANIQMAQAKFEREEPHAGMAVINDVGCLTDIHPNDKRTVARRLALHALKRDYGFDWIVDNSPRVTSWKVEGDKVILTAADAKGWYLYNADWKPDTRFELAGADGVWKPARLLNLKDQDKAGKAYRCRGEIKGAELVLAADGVAQPKKLRYLHSRPWQGNLYSDASLPLGAFALDLVK